MSLEKCKTCGGTVAKTAYFCPKCGAHDPTKAGSRFLKGLFSVLGVLILILILFIYSLGY